MSESCISGTPLAASTSIIAETSGIAPPEIPVDACQHPSEVQVDVPSEIPVNTYQPHPEIPVNACQHPSDISIDVCRNYSEIPVNACQPTTEIPVDACQHPSEIQVDAYQRYPEIPVDACQAPSEVPFDTCQSSPEIPVEICKSPPRPAVCQDNYANSIHSPDADRSKSPVSTPSPPV
eukprot:1084694_1